MILNDLKGTNEQGGFCMLIQINNEIDFVLEEKIMTSINNVIKSVLSSENIPTNIEVSISFVSPEEIKHINNTYRNINKETDVLSFPIIDFSQNYEDVQDLFDDNINLDTNNIMLGDIIISVERALQQSVEYNHSLEREICFLVVHSMLHLLGYDHMLVDEEKIMISKQKEIMMKARISR